MINDDSDVNDVDGNVAIPHNQNNDDQKDDENHDFTPLTPDLIHEAIEQQGFESSGQLLALNSYENRVYRVGLEDAEPLIAKFYRPRRWGIEQLQEEHGFANQLATNEIPVVEPLPDAQGNTLRLHQDYHFALYPVRGGRSPELDNPDQLEIIGRFIGRIHKVAETDNFTHRRTMQSIKIEREAASYLTSESRLPAEVAPAYKALVDDLLLKVEEKFEYYNHVRSIRLHGDLHPGNILWRDETPHIVDLDDCCTGPAIQDLWLFLSGDRHYQQARLADLLEGYTQFREFDPAELGLIEALRTLRMIHYAAWLDKRRAEPAFKQAFPWLYTARFWDDHILELKEQSSALDEPPLIWD